MAFVSFSQQICGQTWAERAAAVGSKVEQTMRSKFEGSREIGGNWSVTGPFVLWPSLEEKKAHKSSPVRSLLWPWFWLPWAGHFCPSSLVLSPISPLFCSVMNLDDLTRRGLYLSDIPLHDATRDLVLLGEQFREEYKLTQELEILTDRLQHTLRALEDEKKKTDRWDGPFRSGPGIRFQRWFGASRSGMSSCLNWAKVRRWPRGQWQAVFPWLHSASQHSRALVLLWWNKPTVPRVVPHGDGFKKRSFYRPRYVFSYCVCGNQMQLLMDITRQREFIQISFHFAQEPHLSWPRYIRIK